ncbi:MAG: hypothetical protein WHX93_05150 [bacterium]
MGKPSGIRQKIPGKLGCFSMIFLALAWGCAALEGSREQGMLPRGCGVEIQSIRVTAAGGFLDLRFKVLDPQGASFLLDPSVGVHLVHEPTGKVLTVAQSKLGRLRQRAGKPELGREYFILFRNSGGIVGVGQKVSLEVGGCKMEGLEVK